MAPQKQKCGISLLLLTPRLCTLALLIKGDIKMNMGHWWDDTDRGNRSTGRETLYSVGGR